MDRCEKYLQGGGKGTAPIVSGLLQLSGLGVQPAAPCRSWLLRAHLSCLFWYRQLLAIPFCVLLISYFTPVESVV